MPKLIEHHRLNSSNVSLPHLDHLTH